MDNKQAELSKLIQHLKSGDHTSRDKAIERLRKEGWLYDFSLKEIDLSYADLSGANLTEARLEKVNLDHANLQKADLTRAWLYNASLRKANMTEVSMRAVRLGFADMREAVLIGSDAGKAEFIGADMSYTDCSVAAFWETNLSNTNLAHADLRVANLRGAKLIHTNLDNTLMDEASIGETVFASIDFTQAIGLDKVEHWRPCYIDIDSLYRSKGNIPEEFLRGCGVPETMITYIKPIVNASKPIEFYKVFFSFSSLDASFSDRLFETFDKQGISCWKYDHEQHLGHDVYDNIDTGLKTSEKVIFISSKSSWASPYVIEEVKYALKQQQKTKQIILIPVTIDDYLEHTDDFLASVVGGKIYAKFQGWEHDPSIFEKGVTHLISALSKASS